MKQFSSAAWNSSQ